jgi:Flp pilus assembly protein TadG
MMMLVGNIRRFAASNRAVAAIEFAMIMPILLLLFLGSFDAGNAIAIYAKVRSATYSLAAITNQYGNGVGTNTPISTSVMTSITGATTAIMAPYSSTPTTVVISQIKATSATAATVSWSYSPTAGQALTAGNSFSLPTGFANNSCGTSPAVSTTNPCYAIYAQVQYTFTPLFGAFISGPITLSDSIYVTPRITKCVQYNGTPSSC